MKTGIQKNEFLKKYEGKVEGVSIDIYVPYYSEFAIPPEEILKNTMRIENFKIPKPEILLILKQRQNYKGGTALRDRRIG